MRLKKTILYVMVGVTVKLSKQLTSVRSGELTILLSLPLGGTEWHVRPRPSRSHSDIAAGQTWSGSGQQERSEHTAVATAPQIDMKVSWSFRLVLYRLYSWSVMLIGLNIQQMVLSFQSTGIIGSTLIQSIKDFNRLLHLEIIIIKLLISLL